VVVAIPNRLVGHPTLRPSVIHLNVRVVISAELFQGSDVDSLPKNSWPYEKSQDHGIVKMVNNLSHKLYAFSHESMNSIPPSPIGSHEGTRFYEFDTGTFSHR
jgi:hypothetical protein